ncbi:MAG: hypothetical protein ACXAC5_01405 [Promethearchaeota archaeon]|jgi:hypothetical protein
MSPLTVTEIKKGTGKTAFTLQKQREINIESHANVLIKSGFVTVDEVQIGDEILAYAFDFPKRRAYNAGVKSKK